MNRQEIFNTVYIALRNQGWIRSVPDNDITCQYRIGSLKCAFGHLIPDDLYHPLFERHPALYLIAGDKNDGGYQAVDNSIGVFTKFREWADANISSDDHGFIQDMQIAHDNGTSPDNMKERFDKNARKYELDIPDETK